eukprot:CAMPEP_0170098822 /NCGR_PEP_ID=MMETSP0020_2-20130122/653_1 /TAXON_ID=98059 /ORGANISM="Dinobryon sp., Strain UTEXLB2267" /LENGTH=100 /DNA_ID=CAMNT_0010321323 /DNA_START=1161 /DNA_END=1463 /DNA_ORIENTATION=-
MPSTAWMSSTILQLLSEWMASVKEEGEEDEEEEEDDLAGDELRLLRVLLLDKQLLLIDVAQPQQRGSEQHCGGHYCPLCHPSPPNTLHIHREEPITHHPH